MVKKEKSFTFAVFLILFLILLTCILSSTLKYKEYFVMLSGGYKNNPNVLRPPRKMNIKESTKDNMYPILDWDIGNSPKGDYIINELRD